MSPVVNVMASPQKLIAALDKTKIVTYFHVASTTAYIYDYILTFPREVSLIWPARWTPIKVLFLLTRYIPFIDGGILIYYHVLSSPNAEACQSAYRAVSWLFYVGKALPEIILTLRTWAVWNKDRRLTIGLPIFFIVCWGPIILILIMFVNSVVPMPITSPALLGCMVAKASHIVGVAWIIMLTFQGGIFLLMLIRAIQCCLCSQFMSGASLIVFGLDKLGGSTKLFQVVYRDGLLYYIYLFAISFTNVIVVATVAPPLQTFFVSTERVVQAIVGCRVVLDIRDATNGGHLAWANSAPSSPPTYALRRVHTTENTDTVVDVQNTGMTSV